MNKHSLKIAIYSGCTKHSLPVLEKYSLNLSLNISFLHISFALRIANRLHLHWKLQIDFICTENCKYSLYQTSFLIIAFALNISFALNLSTPNNWSNHLLLTIGVTIDCAGDLKEERASSAWAGPEGGAVAAHGGASLGVEMRRWAWRSSA